MGILEDYGATDDQRAEAAAYPGWHLARVISQYNETYKIITEDGEFRAVVSGKMRHAAAGPHAYPVVGDFVMALLGRNAMDAAIIECVLKRKSVFSRAAVGVAGQVQIVAANIDVVFICMALNEDYNLSRLERYLSLAWNSAALPVVVLTKADLCADLPQALAEVAGIAPGVPCITTSVGDPDSCKGLRRFLKSGLTASFIGSSGVGKSTLINSLAERDVLRTSPVGQDGKGRHTTTRRELFILPQGGAVIDTPGMRELGVDSPDLSKTFADIEALAGQCRFHDCSHGTEPGCAVKRALEDGTLDKRRWANYQKLQREARYNGLSSRQLESEKFDLMFQEMGGMKKIRKHIRETDKRR